MYESGSENRDPFFSSVDPDGEPAFPPAFGTAGNWSARSFKIAAAASLEESEFLDVFWELSSSNEKDFADFGLWTV